MYSERSRQLAEILRAKAIANLDRSGTTVMTFQTQPVLDATRPSRRASEDIGATPTPRDARFGARIRAYVRHALTPLGAQSNRRQ